MSKDRAAQLAAISPGERAAAVAAMSPEDRAATLAAMTHEVMVAAAIPHEHTPAPTSPAADSSVSREAGLSLAVQQAGFKIAQLEHLVGELETASALREATLQMAHAEIEQLKAAAAKKDAALQLAQQQSDSLVAPSKAAQANQDSFDKLCADVRDRLVMLSKLPSKL